MRARTLALPIVFTALACSAGTDSDLGFGGSGGAGAGDSGSGSTASFAGSTGANDNSTGSFGTGAGTGGSNDGCSAESQLVYVFTTDNEIYSFDPPSKKFTYVATPDCPGGSPNSMAIDRNLVAWINYIGGIYTFDLNTKSGCALALTPPSSFQQVGMGFSSDQVGGTSETLFVDSIQGSGLAKIDTSTKLLTQIGSFDNDSNLVGQSAELTGTGSARLFGYFTTFPYVRVAEIDKTNANVLSDHELTGVTPPSDWAFSFWGGDFYLYAGPNFSGTSSVIKYSPSTQAVDPNYVPDAGFLIIGAGVSTCAPIVPPS
jgi:hypothetical protein